MPNWGFIGSGKMASALIKGMIRAGLASADAIVAVPFVTVPLPVRARLLAAMRGAASVALSKLE